MVLLIGKFVEKQFDFEMSAVSEECWIVKYYQSEDESWNFFVLTDFSKVMPAMEYLMQLGWSPSVESGYINEFVPVPRIKQNKDTVKE